jgi:hypothetical protein
MLSSSTVYVNTCPNKCQNLRVLYKNLCGIRYRYPSKQTNYIDESFSIVYISIKAPSWQIYNTTLHPKKTVILKIIRGPKKIKIKPSHQNARTRIVHYYWPELVIYWCCTQVHLTELQGGGGDGDFWKVNR